MASENRAAPLVLEALERLRREPFQFDFFQALRLLECAYSNRPRLGESLRSSDDAIRLGQDPSLAFAPSTLAAVQRATAHHPERILVYFFGLFGPNGPLPLHLTEYARDRQMHAGDSTFSRFADLFHHRLLSLFYRVTVASRPAVSLDRPESDRYRTYIGALIGLGSPAFRDRDELPDWGKYSSACHLVRHARNADGLRDMVAELLQLPVEIDEFVGHWLEIPATGQWRLGETPETGTVGVSATLGRRLWDCQCKFRLVVGPLSWKDYQRLLPGSPTLARAVAIVRNYTGDEYDWDLRLVLDRHEVPSTRLGRTGQLGWTSWLSSQPPTENADDLTIAPCRARRPRTPRRDHVSFPGDSTHV